MLNKKIHNSYDQIAYIFTKEVIQEFLESIANTLGPSQSVKFTRSPAVDHLIQKSHLENIIFDQNYLGTGNSLFYSKSANPTILFIAHLDQISYLIGKQISEKVYRLLPYCKHLSQIEVSAVALRFDPKEKRYKKISSGILFSEKENGNLIPLFRGENIQLESGDRIVYESPIRFEGDMALGNIDNAAGVASCLLAGIAYYKVYPRSKVGFVFTDEEEGPIENPIYFARGIRRLLRQIPTPDVCLIIDGHGGGDGKDIGKGTFFTEKTGGGIATVTPPELFLRIKNLAKELNEIGIDMFEASGTVSRSDDVPCLEVTPNVISIGYPSMNRHHDLGAPRVSISDLVNLTKAIFWIAATLELDHG